MHLKDSSPIFENPSCVVSPQATRHSTPLYKEYETFKFDDAYFNEHEKESISELGYSNNSIQIAPSEKEEDFNHTSLHISDNYFETIDTLEM